MSWVFHDLKMKNGCGSHICDEVVALGTLEEAGMITWAEVWVV